MLLAAACAGMRTSCMPMLLLLLLLAMLLLLMMLLLPAACTHLHCRLKPLWQDDAECTAQQQPCTHCADLHTHSMSEVEAIQSAIYANPAAARSLVCMRVETRAGGTHIWLADCVSGTLPQQATC